MSRGRSRRRHSIAALAGRGAAALAVAGVGFFAIAGTLATTMRVNAPDRAHALAPGNARIAATLALQLSQTITVAAQQGSAVPLARQALRRDPTAVPAVVALGLHWQVRGDAIGAQKLFDYAQKLSRRDLPTQLWMIEAAVARGNVPAALRHYDIALRTNRGASDLLFPVLAGAAADAGVRSALVQTLAGEPGWGSAFVDYVAGNSPNPRNGAALLLALEQADVPVSSQARLSILDALLGRKLVGDAWTFYAATHPGIDRRRSRDPDFRTGETGATPFDWVPINDGGMSTVIQRDEGLFDFSVPASVGGPLLRQMQLLPAGEYRLDGRSIGLDQPEEARPYWSLNCDNGRELGRVGMSNSNVAGGVFSGRLRVPADCPVQTLVLNARPTDAIGGVTGQISRAMLVPVSW